MKRFPPKSFSFFAWALLLISIFILRYSPASAQPPPAAEKKLPTAEELRKQLDAMEAERANREPEAQLPWRAMGPGAFPAGTDARNALVELRHDASTLSCVWTIRSIADAAAPPLRACLDARGTETIALPAGDYEIQLRVGTAEESSILYPKFRARLRAGEGYQSDFDRKTESAAKKRIAAVAKPAPPGSPGAAPSPPGPAPPMQGASARNDNGSLKIP